MDNARLLCATVSDDLTWSTEPTLSVETIIMYMSCQLKKSWRQSTKIYASIIRPVTE